MLLFLFLLITLFYFLPGILLHVIVRERGITLPVSLGLALAGIIVLDVWVASLFGYRFWIQFALNVIAIAALGWLARSKMQEWIRWAMAWSRHHLILWVAAIFIFIVPAFVIPVPYDTDAQGFGILALTVRLSGSITSLAPFWSEINFFYSPAFFLLAAQLSDMAFGAPMHLVIMALGHAFAAATVMGVWAVGREFGDERIANWSAFFAVISTALFTTMMDSAYTNVFVNFLTAAILVLIFRAAKEPNRFNIVCAIIALASLPLSHPDSIIHLLMAYIPFYFTVWLTRTRPTLKQYATLTIIVPFFAVILCLPWILRAFPLLGGVSVHERQNPSPFHWIDLVAFNGYAPVYLALGGLLLGAWRRRWIDIWMIGNALAIMEISTWGNLDRLSKTTQIDPMQIFYPFGVVWHATIIPIPFLAATMICALPFMNRVKSPHSIGVAVGACAIIASLAAGVFSDALIQWSKDRVRITGALSSAADIRAMTWLKENTSPDALILNYPGIEGDWVPVIAERKTIHFREQLFYIGAGEAWKLQEELRVAYHDPASPESEKKVRLANIAYILIPQVIGNPDSFKSAQRWRPPFIESMRSSFADAKYLELVKDFDGAQIWKVK
ncbi:MAG: hypothetical protein HZB52_02275 [Chloroflexi bacterium]|nr:hypothetical protein [Chloroflexota bacterium]